MNLVIGSGDTTALLSGNGTQGFAKLIQKFVANNKPYYNSFASPINALRSGAILESAYSLTLDDDYFSQYKVSSKEYDCLTSSIDFAKINKSKIVDFDELKTIFFTDFIDIIKPISYLSNDEQIKVLKKKFKSNYNQVQFQLLCSGLDSANLVFMSVESYDDDDNHKRILNDNDFVKFRIERDNNVIDKIIYKAKYFQDIKNFINK